MAKYKVQDHELVAQFIEGDKAAIEQLIKRHKNRVYTYILLIVKNEHLAEDIFQDAFIKVIKSLKKGKYLEKGIFVSWVIRIAHNLIIDHFRKNKNPANMGSGSHICYWFKVEKYSHFIHSAFR